MALLREVRPVTITMLARSRDKSIQIKENFKELIKHTKFFVDNMENFENYLGKTDLLINTTPCGMWPDIASSPLLPGYILKFSQIR